MNQQHREIDPHEVLERAEQLLRNYDKAVPDEASIELVAAKLVDADRTIEVIVTTDFAPGCKIGVRAPSTPPKDEKDDGDTPASWATRVLITVIENIETTDLSECDPNAVTWLGAR